MHHQTLGSNTFEERLGARLFERLPTGYSLTAPNEKMREVALHIEEQIAALGRKVAGQDLRLRGTIRITAVDMLALGVLPAYLADFRTACPGITLDVVVSPSRSTSPGARPTKPARRLATASMTPAAKSASMGSSQHGDPGRHSRT